MQLERGARQKLRTLLRLLDRGIVSGGDADEMIHLLQGALSLTGVVITDDWSYRGWNRTAGITTEWMQTYEQVSHHDPSAEILSREPAGQWWLLHGDAGVAGRRLGAVDVVLDPIGEEARSEAERRPQGWSSVWRGAVHACVDAEFAL